MAEGRLYNVSTASDIVGPIGFNHGPWFVSLVTSADLNGTGTCGRRLWLVDYFAGPQDGNSKIGVRHFAVQLGDAVNGSEGQLVTKDGTLIGDVRTPGGFIDMRFESPDPGVPNPDTRGETIVTIPMGYANLPPIPFPGSRCRRASSRPGTAAAFSTATAARPARMFRCTRITSRTTRTLAASGRAPAERTTPIVTAAWCWGRTSSSVRGASTLPSRGPSCNIGNRVGLCLYRATSSVASTTRIASRRARPQWPCATARC